MKTSEKIKTRIRKLLSLATSSNVNEAAVAAAAAQALIDQHHIDLAMLDEEDSKELFEEEPVIDPEAYVCFETTKKVVAWKWHLLYDICMVNDCRSWSKRYYDEHHEVYNRKFYAIGRPSDAAQVVELFQFVVAQIEHLAKTMDHEPRPGESKRAFLNSFRHGAGTEVGNRLTNERNARRRALREEAEAKVKAAKALEGPGSENALVLAETALQRAETAIARLEKRPKQVEALMEFHDMKYAKGSNSYTGSGFAAGRRAGKTVRTSTGQKALT